MGLQFPGSLLSSERFFWCEVLRARVLSTWWKFVIYSGKSDFFLFIPEVELRNGIIILLILPEFRQTPNQGQRRNFYHSGLSEDREKENMGRCCSV